MVRVHPHWCELYFQSRIHVFQLGCTIQEPACASPHRSTPPQVLDPRRWRATRSRVTWPERQRDSERARPLAGVDGGGPPGDGRRVRLQLSAGRGSSA